LKEERRPQILDPEFIGMDSRDLSKDDVSLNDIYEKLKSLATRDLMNNKQDYIRYAERYLKDKIFAGF
jgi:hypothetical protein